MGDRLVLALDGSTSTCSAALLRMHGGVNGEGSRWTAAARRALADGRAQARVMLRLVDEMLEETDRGPRDLGAVVVGVGPGTFTGVRITVATARALSLALSVPVLGISTLGALAACAAAADAASAGTPSAAPSRGAAAWSGAIDGECRRLLMSVVDARRGQLFYGLYRSVGAGSAPAGRRWVRSTEFGVCDRGALGELITAAANGRPDAYGSHDPDAGGDLGAESVLVVGEGATSVADLPAGAIFRNTDVGAEWLLLGQDRLDEPGSLPQGSRLAPWLAGVFASEEGVTTSDPVVGGLGTPESVTPVYVRAPDADIHITKMRDPWADGSRDR